MPIDNAFPFFPCVEADTVEHVHCHGCGMCVMVCPSHALTLDGLSPSGHVFQKNPVFNAGLCVHCGRCASVCLSNTLHQQRFSILLRTVQKEQIHTVVFFCRNLQALMPTSLSKAEVPEGMSLAQAHMVPQFNTIKLPPGVLFEGVRCVSRVGARLIDRMVLAGVRRVLLFAGPQHLCHYNEGLSLMDTQGAGLASVYAAYGIEARIESARWIPQTVQEVEDYIAEFVAK